MEGPGREEEPVVHPVGGAEGHGVAETADDDEFASGAGGGAFGLVDGAG